jgi:hypothetical protein
MTPRAASEEAAVTPEAPPATELQANAVVQAAFAAAWADSLADDPALRHEEGGFIYVNATTGDVDVRRAPPGGRDSLDLSSPPRLADCFLAATFHTHPNPTARGWDPTPSSEDYTEAEDSGVPWFVITDSGVYAVGPDRRVGGLAGSPGYPI